MFIYSIQLFWQWYVHFFSSPCSFSVLSTGGTPAFLDYSSKVDKFYFPYPRGIHSTYLIQFLWIIVNKYDHVMIYLWENICRIQLFIFVQGTLIQEIYIYIYYFFGSWRFSFSTLRYKWMVLLRFFCKVYFVIIANLFLHARL